MADHSWRSESARGFGHWLRCDHCGATEHSGWYWLGGWKSKAEPPCTPWRVDPAWWDSAKKVPLEQ